MLKTREVPEFVNWLEGIINEDNYFKVAEDLTVLLPQQGYSDPLPIPMENYEFHGKNIHVFLVAETFEPQVVCMKPLDMITPKEE